MLPWERCAPTGPTTPARPRSIHCSEEDGTSAADGVQTARRAIEEAGGDCHLYDYPGTSHAFFNDDRPEAFDQRAAASAWARTLELFRAKLG